MEEETIPLTEAIRRYVGSPRDWPETRKGVVGDESVSGMLIRVRGGYRVRVRDLPAFEASIREHRPPRIPRGRPRKGRLPETTSPGTPGSLRRKWGDYDADGVYDLAALVSKVTGGDDYAALVERRFCEEHANGGYFREVDGVRRVPGSKAYRVLEALEDAYRTLSAQPNPDCMVGTDYGDIDPGWEYPLMELCGKVIGEYGTDPKELAESFRTDGESQGLYKFDPEAGFIIREGCAVEALGILGRIYQEEFS